MSEPCRCWPTPEEQHFVYYGITEPGSAWEYNPYCPEHGDFPRWRITCVNWGHKDAPKFAAWMPGPDAVRTHYTYTYAEAWAYINAVAARVEEHLRRKQ